MNELDTKYHQEAVNLRLLWNAFYDLENTEIFETDDEVHVHTPPAVVMFFDKIMTELIDINYLDDVSMINIMDCVFKFGVHFGSSGFAYKNFTKCECVQITSDDIELMKQGIG